MKLPLLLILSLQLCASGNRGFARDMVKEAAIEQELGAIDPNLVEPFREARMAMDKGDYAETARLLQPVCEAAPTFDAAERRLGLALAETGHHEEALQYGTNAVKIRRSADNLATYAEILIASPNRTVPTSDKALALSAIREATSRPDGRDPSFTILEASLALELNDKEAAQAAIARLRQEAPDQMLTHYFAAIQAADDEHWVVAKREIQKAQQLGLPEETVQKFLAMGVGSRAMAWEIGTIMACAIALWAVGIVVLCVVGFALSRLTLRQIEKSDGSVRVSPGEHRLRVLYRTILNLAGIYYYLSLPVVLILVLGVCGGFLYLFFSIGSIPIKLAVMLVIGAVMTIWSMLRSLFLKVRNTDPGRMLGREEAEGLWRLTEEVAAELKTRPVDEIRITGGTDLAVYERGSWREKMRGHAKRILILGTALLPDFQQEEFRSVLAHEYGHFSHRDTAGGDVAFRVQRDMLKFYHAMLAAKQATRFNIAFRFLKLYHFIFRRISHGATRLQEVLADRVAAQVYGPVAFKGGLRHVIRRSVGFELRANHEIKDALQGARPLRNLYALAPAEPEAEEKTFQEAMGRPTTSDDTHPGPKDRFRYIAKVVSADRPKTTGVVWDLFRDPQGIMDEMLAQFEQQVARHRK